MKGIRKYGVICKTSLSNSFAYGKALFTNTAFYFFLIYVLLMLWKTIYGNGKTISGYSLTQMIWYLIVTEMMWTMRGISFEDINDDIKSGSIAYYINKPYNYVLYLVSDGLGKFSAKMIVSIIAGIVMGFLYVGPLNGFRFEYIPFIFVTVIFAILLNFFMMIPLALSAFWTEENIPFRWIYSKLTLIIGVLIPVELYPVWIQPNIKYLPFLYTTYGPAKLVVDFSYGKFVEIFALQSIYLVLFILISFAVYNKGVKRLNVNGG